MSASGRALLLPTQAAIALFRQTLESAAGGAAFIVPELMTRDAWLGRVHQAIAGAPPVLSRFEREVLMGRAAEAAARRPRMLRAPFELRPGLITEMLGLYDDLRRRQRTVRRFVRVLFEELGGERGMDRGSESLIHQTSFLALTFLGYERGVAASGSLDEHGLRRLVLERADEFPFRHVVIAVGDHPADPRGLWPADFDLLGRLGGRIDLDLVVTDETHDAGFRQRIEEELPGIIEVKLEARSQKPEVADRPILIRPLSDDAETLCWVHRDREEELRDVAKSIRRQAALTGHELREPTAIVFQRPLPYLYLADQVLDGARVPFQTFDTLPLAGEPYAALLDLVLDVARTGGTRETVVALLRSRLVAFEVDGEVVSVDDAAALSVVLTERRAAGEADSYPREVDAYFGGRPARQGVEAPRARKAARAAAAISAALRPFRNHAAASHQIGTLSAFLRQHERPAEPGEHDAPSSSRYKRGRAAILGILAGLADAVRRHDDRPRDAGRLAGEIRHGIQGHTFAAERAASGISLVDAVAARFGEFDHVHLVGLVDTEWPERPRRNIFYTSGLLKSLGWPQEQDDARAQQAAFRDLVRLPARTLQLHGFQLEGDGLVGVSPAVELARELPSRIAEPLPALAVFADELLTGDAPAAAGLGDESAAWLQLRTRRPPLDDRAYSGFVGPRAARSYRVSRVDRFVDCPFKFFAEDVLGLPEEREEWSGLSPLERGTLVHSLFESFYRDWQQSGRGTITADTLPDALDRFGRLTREALSTLPEADRSLEETRLLGSIVGRGLAERVFELEADAGGDVVNRLIEFPLEGPFTFPRLSGLDQRVVEIRGKADRIDVFANGELRVIDYKLSKLPDRETSIQIAVYAWAVQQALEASDGRPHPVTNAMYLAFGDERHSEGRLDTPGAKTVATIAARASDFAAAIDRIEAGEYPPAPLRPGDCQWCRYAGVCRKEYATESV